MWIKVFGIQHYKCCQTCSGNKLGLQGLDFWQHWLLLLFLAPEFLFFGCQILSKYIFVIFLLLIKKIYESEKIGDFSSPAITFPFQPRVELCRSREDPARSRVSTRGWPSRLEARVSLRSSCPFPTNIRQPNDHRLLPRLIPEFISMQLNSNFLDINKMWKYTLVFRGFALWSFPRTYLPVLACCWTPYSRCPYSGTYLPRINL